MGAPNVRRDARVRDGAWASGLEGTTPALVAPADAAQVAEVVAWCAQRDVAIVAAGGLTGYCGGAVPVRGDEVVLSLTRLDRVRALDPVQRRTEVEAGVTTATVARRAREEGLWWPVDPGAAESSTIGGNVATNAGGPHAFRHGVTRAWVTGVEAVLADGALVRVGGPLPKDVAGYDLVGLLCGSEGTLGIVTSAWLRLRPSPPAQLPVAAVGVEPQAALEAVLACGVESEVLEVVDASATRWAPAPWWECDAGDVVLVEATGEADAGVLAAALREAGAGAVVRPPAGELWRWRAGVSIAVTAARGGKLSEDVAVPLDRVGELLEAVLAIGARHGLDACSWGHLGDGNLHATFLLDPGDAAQRARADDAARELFATAAALGGTVSGEHGLGVLKAGELERQWAPAALDAHEAVKRALDPRGLLNPGKKQARGVAVAKAG